MVEKTGLQGKKHMLTLLIMETFMGVASFMQLRYKHLKTPAVPSNVPHAYTAKCPVNSPKSDHWVFEVEANISTILLYSAIAALFLLMLVLSMEIMPRQKTLTQLQLQTPFPDAICVLKKDGKPPVSTKRKLERGIMHTHIPTSHTFANVGNEVQSV